MPSFLRLLSLALVPALLCAWGDSPKPPTAQGGEKAVKQPDAAAIARLVEKLGSKDFTERQEATKALEAIGFPALDALRKAAKGNNAEVVQRAARLVAVIENGFDSLLADYRGYGLPLPPKDAKLVKFESGGRYILNDKLMPPTYFLGFLLRSATKENPALQLVGAEEVRLDSYKTIEVVEPKPELVKELDLRWWGPSTFGMNAGLAVALQCKARGWNDLAEQLWTASIKQASGHPYVAFYQPENLPNRTAVAYLAWAYSGNELVKPDTERTKTAKRIEALFSAEPRLKNEDTQALLKSLEAALMPSTAKPGSVERMADDLTDVCNTGRSHDEADPRYTRLAQMGFAAVPALIEHLDDDRLTRSFIQGFNNFPPWIRPVKHVVTDLLKDLAGAENRKDWGWQQDGWTVAKEDAQAWWEKARKVGEETYFLSHVLPEGGDSPNSLMLDIIVRKYPKHLPKLYKTILDERPKMQSWPLAEAVAKSSLPDDKKRELFPQEPGAPQVRPLKTPDARSAAVHENLARYSGSLTKDAYCAASCGRRLLEVSRGCVCSSRPGHR